MKKRICVFLVFIMVLALCIAMSTVAFAADGKAVAAPKVNLDTGDASAAIVLPDTNIDLEAAVGTLLAMLVFATIIETLAEWIKAALPNSLPKWGWLCVTSLIGIGLSIIFKIDFFAAIGFAGGVFALIVGEVFTGIFIGAGSSFIHNLIDKLYAVKVSLKTPANTSNTTIINNSNRDTDDDTSNNTGDTSGSVDINTDDPEGTTETPT